MATFDATQTTSLAEIFGATSDYMSQYLSVRSGIITDADKTSILTRVTAYQAIESDNLEMQANLRNFGANVSAIRKRALIKGKIAALIGWDMGTDLVRG